MALVTKSSHRCLYALTTSEHGMEATGDLQAEDGSVGSVFDGRHVSHVATIIE
jgi:hypothetical protein